MEKWVLHIDMDAFYASIEQRDNEKLKGKPVIVGGIGSRGVVSTASYEARVFGVHSAMPISQAKKLCPHGIFVMPNHKKYKQISDIIIDILKKYSPIVEQVSIDEAFLDLTGMQLLIDDLESFGRKIQDEIIEKTGLTSSVGIAPNKFLAKFASDFKKPFGLTIIRKDEAKDILSPLPVKYLMGIGKVTENKLKNIGINTIKQFRETKRDVLAKIVGSSVDTLLLLANGIDERRVIGGTIAKSIGKENTYSSDISDIEEIKKEVLLLSQQVGWRLRKKGFCGHTLTLKVRFFDFETISRSTTSEMYFYYDENIYKTALSLLRKYPFKKSVRLLGVTVSNLKSFQKCLPVLDFDGSQERLKKRTDAIDNLKKRFGEEIIVKGGVFKKDEI